MSDMLQSFLLIGVCLFAPLFIPIKKMASRVEDIGDKGSVAIEFAIVTPVLILLALGSVDILQLAQARQAVATLATSTCQIASRAGTSGGGWNVTSANNAGAAAFSAAVSTAFLFQSTVSNVLLNIDDFPGNFPGHEVADTSAYVLQCRVTVTITPMVGYIGSAPVTFTQTAID